MDFLYWHLDLHQQAQTLLIHIITLDGFSPFHSSFMVIDGCIDGAATRQSRVQLEGEKVQAEINE